MTNHFIIINDLATAYILLMLKMGALKYVKLVVMMLCAIVGVGFVSGAEIYSFYARFGKFSYLSIIIFFVLMFLLINKILKQLSNNTKISKMENLTSFAPKNTISPKTKIKSVLTYFNVSLVASAMFAGLFSLIKNLCFNNYVLIWFLAIFFVFTILLLGIRGLEKFDYVVISFLMFLATFFLWFLMSGRGNIDAIKTDNNFRVSTLFSSALFACLYVFMNIVQIQPILAEFKVDFSKKKRMLFAFVFAFTLSILLFVFVEFLKSNPAIFEAEMPFLNFFKSKNKVLFYIYVVGLVLALLSSLLSCLIGVKRGICKYISSNVCATALSIVLCLVVSLIGFSNFVSIVYPIIGVINFIIFVFL